MLGMKSRRHTHKTLFVGLLAVLLLTPGVLADLGLDQYSSRFYQVHTNCTPEQVKPHAAHMDHVYASFRKRFGGVFRSRRRQQPTLYLLNSRDDYIKALGAFDIDGTHSGGIFFSKGRDNSGLATWIEGQDPDHLWHTLQHEAFHQFAWQYIGPTMPVWANEGLAEYFGDALVVRGKLKLGIVNQRRLETVRAAIDSGVSIPIPELIHITSKQWQANMGHPLRGRLQYAQSWSLAYFLVHGDKRYRQAFERYLQHLSRGLTHAQAYERGFGNASERAMEARWREYIAELEPDPFSTAVHRLEFLARGTRWLIEQDMARPTSIEELKEQLQTRQFSVRSSTGHGNSYTLEARDDDMFVYTTRADEPEPFVMLPAQAPDEPLMLAAPKLRPRPVIKWTRDRDRLIFKVEYE